MIRMHVRVDHVTDRLVGDRANRISKLAPGHGAAERIDDRNPIASHDKTRIRHVAAILRRLNLIAALMHEHARGNLADIGLICQSGRHIAEQRRCCERERSLD